MAHLQLCEHEVHLWYADPERLRSDRAYAAGVALLAPEEGDRLESLAFARDRRIFLATRVLVRVVLSRYERVAPAAWRFAADEYGRPRVCDPTPDQPAFNLSNTRGLVVCGLVRDTTIGVDAERVDSTPPLEVADRYFAPAELADLRPGGGARCARRFYDYWTLKESYAKALGLGLVLPLDRLQFRMEDGSRPRLVTGAHMDKAPEAWQFTQHRPTADHVVSVCVPGRSAERVVVARWLQLAAAAGRKP
jgi:4'-phosphopantetheinyl transferase